MQHDSQELATWLACHQDAALKQLKTLRSNLETVQSTACASADHVHRHQSNITMLAQKEQQYALQLQTLEERLTSVKYSPLVRFQVRFETKKPCGELVRFASLILTGLCFCSCVIIP